MKISSPPPKIPAASTEGAAPKAPIAQTPPAAAGWAAAAKTRGVEAPAASGSKSPGDVATAFYKAFVTQDFETMKSLYAPHLKFKDMMFEYGDREGAMHMWKKLLSGEGKFEYKLDRVEGDVAHGHWVADYKLGSRQVHNELTSELTIRDGKIVKHEDHSDWKKWAPQALPLGPLVNLPGVRWLVTKAVRGFIDM